jgi:hypothetical protein
VFGGVNLLALGFGRLVDLLGKKLLNAMGLSEKIVLPSEYGGGGTSMSEGGSVVASADAPVAFGREQSEASFSRLLHRSQNGDVIMHIREPFYDVITNAALGTQQYTSNTLYPFNANFALIKQVAANYQWFRILAVKLHYTHWCATSIKARVCIAAAGSDTYNNSAASTANNLAKLEHFAAGSAYEDFGLYYEPTSNVNWYACYPTMGATNVTDFDQGVIMTSVDLNSSTNETIGTLYVEFVVAFREQRNPSVTVGISSYLEGLVPKSALYQAYAKLFSSLPEREAENILVGVDTRQIADAIRRVRREGVEYTEAFDKLWLLLDEKGSKPLPQLVSYSQTSPSPTRL